MKYVPWQIGASSCGCSELKKDIFEAYERARIYFMEISLNFNCNGIERVKEVYSHFKVNTIRRYAKETGVNIWSYHLPFDHNEVNPASLDKSVRSQTIELDKRMIEDAAEVGVKYAILHASGEPISSNDRSDSMKYAKESILILNETAKQNGIILAVECLPRTCLGKDSSEILELISGDDAIKVCFDVNHLLSETHKDFIQNVGNKIETLHISDYDFIDEKHWIPGKGKIDWNELIELLKEIGYNGVFMNEVSATSEFAKEEGKPTYTELREANEKLLIKLN